MARPKRNGDRSNSLIVTIRTLHQALRAELDSALKAVGHTLPQQAVMVTLLRLPRASNAELARAAFVSPQSMAELLQSLEKAGWVERSPDPANARVLQTRLTASGIQAVARAGKELAQVERRLTGALSAGEQQQLRVLLSRCLAALS